MFPGVIFILPEGVNLILPEGVKTTGLRGSNVRGFSKWYLINDKHQHIHSELTGSSEGTSSREV